MLEQLTVELDIVSSREEEYSLQSQWASSARGHQIVVPEDVGDGAVTRKAHERSDAINNALQYIAPAMCSIVFILF